jgi:hypothetical protein
MRITWALGNMGSLKSLYLTIFNQRRNKGQAAVFQIPIQQQALSR